MRAKIPIEAALLLNYNMTLRDLKSEALLIFVHLLLNEFMSGFSDDKGIACKTQCDEQTDFIYKKSIELNEYLKDNLIETYETMKVKMDNALKSDLDFNRAKVIEPLAYYYDVVAKTQTRLVDKNENWLPEVIAFTLIELWILEEEKSFNKHKFIREINLTKVMENIHKIHSISKKVNDTFLKNLIVKMMDISEVMAKKLSISKFKIAKSHSKKKRKKR